MRIERLLKIIEDILPRNSGIVEDRIGLQIQGGRKNISKILVTMEVDDNVVREAIQKKSDCIITFHPLIFHPLISIEDDDRVGRLSSMLIKNSITLISVHTNFDVYPEGTSKILADRLGLEFLDFLVPNPNFKNRGMGIIAKPKKPISTNELLNAVQKVCLSPIRYSSGKGAGKIRNVAIVGGSGSSFIKNALAADSDAFITADISYHHFHEASGKMLLIDPGHYEMEQFVPQGLSLLLKNALKKEEDLKINCSSILTNPVRYYPDSEKYVSLQKKYLINNN
jgi:dinuclear metal center YbgI/SA1388 family protein